MSSTEVTIPHDWTPRPHQRALFDQFGHGKTYRRGCAVWHRRAGKDSCALNLTARDMFRRVGTYWHLFPEQAQARRAIWNGIDRAGRRIIDQMLPPAVRARTSAQEMLIETVNGSIWQMAGSDNFDSLVGSNPVGVVFSEWALSHPDAWEYLRPILVENDGWALFIYTPRGRNHGHATYMRALQAETWFCEKLTVDDTGLITLGQIEEERRAGMSDGKIGQEFYCSFDADIDEQLIPHDLVSAAMARKLTAQRWEEKVIGVDVARFGDDKSALYFRHGRDGNPRPYERYAGPRHDGARGQGRRADQHLEPGRGLRRRRRRRRRGGRSLASAGLRPGDRRQLRRQGGSRGHGAPGRQQTKRDVALGAGVAPARLASAGRASRGRADGTDVHLQCGQRADARA